MSVENQQEIIKGIMNVTGITDHSLAVHYLMMWTEDDGAATKKDLTDEGMFGGQIANIDDEE